MAGFRFLAMWFILFLLLGIIIENFIERKEKPIFLLLMMIQNQLYYKRSTF